ncbi:MAG: agmatine deiminase family protein, partial [Clostridiales bacterium]|nr:agmatine deiminase family protein [Clostridiales bacterium]
MHPNQIGFYMPAEWSAHDRTFLSWPVQASMCYPEDYNRVSKDYYQSLVKAIAEFEPVTVIINPEEIEEFGAQIQSIDTTYPVDFLAIPHNDAWLRDNGPTFVINDQDGMAGVNWDFNAWGEKYSPWDLDNGVAPKILDHYDIQRFDVPLIMEGGSIHTDGEGTILTTEECLLNPNRNSSLSKDEIEKYLHSYLGAEQVIWLKRGLYGDETDGHIDNIACFAAPGKILLQVCADKDDPNYDISRENVQIL